MKSALLDEAKRLSVTERIELIEAIWDTVDQDESADEFPLSDEHRAELDRRLADWQEHPEDGAPWSEVRERLRQR